MLVKGVHTLFFEDKIKNGQCYVHHNDTSAIILWKKYNHMFTLINFVIHLQFQRCIIFQI